ncbi:MAG TPA: phenylacetic acid degradation protein PaaB [Actinomycetes bacterium]|jgi:phenylacetate-CoA oxygenase PaaH subunit|nr:phenylacetic acid degradation protein PaaB [Actinomycetes bacterium]
MDALSDQASAGGALQVYEVFRQEREGGPMQHAGNLLAPDPELASHYAREFYGRRQESVRLWIVPRAAIRRLDDPDLLQPPMDRTFKKPLGYSADIKRKLAAARARAGAVDSADAEDEDPVVAAGRKGVEQQ